MTDPADPFELVAAAAARLRKLAGVPSFDVAIVLGSGWQAAADAIGTPHQEITPSNIRSGPAVVRQAPRHQRTARP
jgi:purine-nucleoside phosphorylase